MTFKGYEIIRERNGNAIRWHVYDETGRKLTRVGFKSKAAAKQFCMERDLRRI